MKANFNLHLLRQALACLCCFFLGGIIGSVGSCNSHSTVADKERLEQWIEELAAERNALEKQVLLLEVKLSNSKGTTAWGPITVEQRDAVELAELRQMTALLPLVSIHDGIGDLKQTPERVNQAVRDNLLAGGVPVVGAATNEKHGILTLAYSTSRTLDGMGVVEAMIVLSKPGEDGARIPISARGFRVLQSEFEVAPGEYVTYLGPAAAGGWTSLWKKAHFQMVPAK